VWREVLQRNKQIIQIFSLQASPSSSFLSFCPTNKASLIPVLDSKSSYDFHFYSSLNINILGLVGFEDITDSTIKVTACVDITPSCLVQEY